MQKYILTTLIAVFVLALGMAKPVMAEGSGEFSIQVPPSPLVATVKPGESTELELKIRNTGSLAENLKINPRAFKIDPSNQQLQISEDQMPEITSWIHFSMPAFTVQSGQTFSEKVTLAVPKDAGFSYSFALIIGRSDQAAQHTGNTLKASVAIFTLINVDRPGAIRALEISKFSTTQGSYEYLPAEFHVELKNTGNTIVQPSGNIFILQGETPVDTLLVNEGGGYILPGAARTLSVKWENGLQVVRPKVQADSSTKNELTWQWENLSHMRFGQYTARLVAIYNDGHRDVPLQSEITFWILPWGMMAGALVLVGLVGLGIWSLASRIVKVSRKSGRKKMRLGR